MKTLLSNKAIFQILGVFLLLMSLTSVGCTSDITPTLPSLKIKVDTLLFAAPGGIQEVRFETNRDWFLEKIGRIDWLEISTDGGSAENGYFTITVAESTPDADARMGKLQLHASAQGAVIVIIQSGVPIVTTLDVAAKDESSALIGGNWHFALEINLAECGIAYSTDGISYTYVDSGEREKNDYQVLLEGLAEATEYQYKAYIKTAEGEYYYGEVKTFTTDPKSELIKISELRAMSGIISQYVKIEAIVLNDTVNKNYSGTNLMQVVDRANPDQPNQGIQIMLPPSPEYNIGDVIEVKLNAGRIEPHVSNSVCIVSVEAMKVTKIGTATVTPVKIDHTQMADYESMYVEVENTQLTKAYISTSNYPTWNGENHPKENTTYIMEVDGSEETYGLYVNKGASFANDVVKTGSGTTKGIVGYSSSNLVTIWPNKTNDISLTGDRFQTMQVLKFTSTTFSGDLTINEVATATCIVSVYYQNAEEGDVIAGPISVELDGAGDGLSTTDQSNIVLRTGSGSLTFQVKGKPTTVGNITFTVKGLDAYGLTGDKAKATGRVSSDIPEGNFTANWKPLNSDKSSSGASTPLALTSNSHPNVVVSTVVGTGISGANGSGHFSYFWGGLGSISNSVANPSVYADFSISTGTNTFSLYYISCALRRNASGDNVCTLQYKIDGGSFTTVYTLNMGTSTSGELKKNLSSIAEIQNMPPGTTVTFRIIPTGVTDGAGRWGIAADGSKTGLTITGDVQ